ncbi:hypothetical protein [Haloarcula salina]|uniref:Uncharacterized protein n=1 Tax=Haloarcula salina TaxID=1429914 RepID=A0AA41FZH7_9EURY|nr:hypothetical protein [Haloarcula salina]MBV0900646.1 hypothetical protein [Haloarcula salina]
MANISKWILLAATLVSAAVIFVSAVLPVAYEQALVNLLVGELAALALGHATYRVSSGKPVAPMSMVLAIVSGVAMFLSPLFIEPVDPILTIMFASGVVVTVGGVVGVVGRVLGGEEQRRSGGERIAERARTEQSGN